jgi:CRP/FNR family transcriptional regulator, cyclic AMP receptor protein
MKENTIKDVERIKCSSESLAEMLESTQWANEFSWNQLMTMSNYMKAYRAIKGTVIFNEGELDSSLGIIVEGRIDIIKTDDQKTQSVIATLVAGNTFGEMSLVDAEPRSAQAVASIDVVMLIMTKDALFDLEKVTPSLAFKLLWKISTMISRRLRRTSGQLVDYLSEND